MNQAVRVGVLAVSILALAPGSQAGDLAWQVRARAVHLDFDNSQSAGLPLAGTTRIEAGNRWIPEVDVSCFFTANVAAELVLMYPQTLDILVGGSKQGHIKAMMPSLLVQYHCTHLGAFRPYAGVGLNGTLFSDRDRFLGGAAKVDGSSVGLVAQLGLDSMINTNWGVNLDAKYIRMDTDVKIAGTKVGTVGLNPLAIGMGVAYRF